MLLVLRNAAAFAIAAVALSSGSIANTQQPLGGNPLLVPSNR
jgi:hypothetical protein